MICGGLLHNRERKVILKKLVNFSPVKHIYLFISANASIAKLVPIRYFSLRLNTVSYLTTKCFYCRTSWSACVQTCKNNFLCFKYHLIMLICEKIINITDFLSLWARRKIFFRVCVSGVIIQSSLKCLKHSP